MKSLVENRWLGVIVVAYLILGISYLLATPPLEASDEYKHYPVVQYLQREGRMPVLDPQDPGRWLQEAAQPPLYYALMAALTTWVDTGDLPQLHQLNKHAFIGDPNQVANKNLIIHDPQREAFPWHGSVLAIYVIRFATLLLGAGTVLLTERIGRLAFNRTVGLVAAALTAFNPMFLFVTTAVNNDALAILLGHAALLLLLYIWREPPHPVHGWRRFAALGFVLGLGLLTKLSLAGLLLLSGLLLVIIARKRRDVRYLFVSGALVALVAVALAAPWLWRNWQLYGDATAMNVFIAVQGSRESPITWRGWEAEFGTFYRSFWGLFGGVNVAAPEPLYVIYNVFALLASAGFGLWLWRRRGRDPADPPLWALLLAWPLLLFLLLVRWNVISEAFQGRLIFPALGALGALWSAGLMEWFPRRRRNGAAVTTAVAAFLIAALLPWQTIRPAYAFPAPLEKVPEAYQIGPMHFHTSQTEIDLVGAYVPPEQSVVAGGEPVRVVLYWQAAQPVDRDYLSSVQLLGRDLQPVASLNRHPASGMIPTGNWEAGQIWRDEYRLTVAQGAEAPSRLLVRAALYDPRTERDLPITGPSGEPIELLVLGEARLAARPGAETPRPPIAQAATLEDGIGFEGYGLAPQPAHAGTTVEVALYWRAYSRPQQDYTIFVHLLDRPGAEPINTGDGPPVEGYYPTSFWHSGDVIRDVHRLPIPADLPPGEYQIGVGVYNPSTGRRLARADGGGDVVLMALQVVSGD